MPSDYVTHGSDRPLWGLRHDMLTDDELDIARAWLDAIDFAVKERLHDRTRPVDEMIVLQENQSMGWCKDDRWPQAMVLAQEFGI